MSILSVLLGAAIASSAPQALPHRAPAPVHAATPALWVVNDNDTIIYLFGTFHALDGESRWFDQAVRTAFTESDELVLETLVPRPPAPNYGFDNRDPAPLQASRPAARNGPGTSYLDTSKAVMNAGRTRGLSTDHGADAVLRDVADIEGKRVGGLESFEFQMRMFGTMQGSSKPLPRQDEQTVRALANLLQHLQSGWHRGAAEETFAPMLMSMRAQSPHMYRTMFVERNTRWAHWIANRMKSPGTVFLAVGAGHLSGPDSVQNQLAMLGVRSARVN